MDWVHTVVHQEKDPGLIIIIRIIISITIIASIIVIMTNSAVIIIVMIHIIDCIIHIVSMIVCRLSPGLSSAISYLG